MPQSPQASAPQSPAQRTAEPTTALAVSTRADDPTAIIAKQGWIVLGPLTAACAACALLAHLFAVTWLAVTLWAITALCLAFCLWFFRDPQRRIPTHQELVLSAADGLVMRVEPCHAPEELGVDFGPTQRVVVFLNVFNVHVNRAPIAGKVVSVARKGGLFAHAGKAKAELNARCSMALQRSDGALVGVTQITGLIARRIICRASQGETLREGQRFGLIRFGSRTDVYLPMHAQVLVKPGETVRGGSSVLAHLPRS